MATTNKNKQLNVSKLDFEDIKTNLKEFLRSQDTLRDYNFEGSALSTIVDLMAYVTHYNAVNANIGINETFLETAQNRGSVVGHARQLSYTPRSMTGATARVNIVVNSPNSLNLTLRKYHPFITTIDGVSYSFVTIDSYETTNAIFDDVTIKQGRLKTVEYIYDLNTSEKFIIPDINVDISTVAINVRESVNSSTLYTFNKFKNIIDIDENSRAFFVNETFDGNYEITFGDGVIGQGLTNGNVIEIDYLICDALEGNGATGFRTTQDIDGNSNISLTVLEAANGGLGRESNAEIKYRAPLTFIAQNRAVTADDFKAIILENFANVKSISVWGGEDNDPPQYGKAFISIKPAVGNVLSITDKNYIINDVIKPKAVLSITPEFVDPSYTYVDLEIFYKFDPSETILSTSALTNKVKAAVATYNDSTLEKFDGILRYSSLLREIDNADTSIISSNARLYMKTRFVPTVNELQLYTLQFSSPIYGSCLKENVIRYSSTFTYQERQCKLEDTAIEDGRRILQIVFGTGDNQIILNDNAGYIDAASGKIILDNFVVSAFEGNYIELSVMPNSNDIAPLRNNLVSIDMDNIFINGLTDSTLSGWKDYDLVPRNA